MGPLRGVMLTLLLVGCETVEIAVTGPFTGTTHRYAIDAIRLPTSGREADELGGDLNGGANNLGWTIVHLRQQGNVTDHPMDMIVGGAIRSSIEITADDLGEDPAVGVRFLGTPDSPYVELGGTIRDGVFTSNRVAKEHVWGEAELHLPVFDQADPSLVAATGVQMSLVPDGAGGFDASVQAAIPTGGAFRDDVHRGITQMLASEPSDHRMFIRLLDHNRDGAVSYGEVVDNYFVNSLIAPDMVIDGRRALSFGFHAHFRPCDAGNCLDSVPFDHCFDRLRDGDETDVDCGGSCRRCESDAACGDGDDCESLVCDANRCGPPSCANGSRDGLESDVDCGADCPGCAVGQRCYFNSDCITGECGPPCIGDDCPSEEYENKLDVCYARPTW